MRLEAVTGRRTGLETVSRSCFTAESPAGNPATRCLVHGPEALRHCLATVLPIAVFRRYMPRLVTIVDYKRGRVNRDTTNGPVRPTSGLSCGSQHHHQGARVDGRCRRRREFVLSVKRVLDKRQDSETSRLQSGRGTHNPDTPLTSATGLAGNFPNSGKCRPACTSPGLHRGCSCNRTARTMPAGSWPFGGTHRMSCLRAYPTLHKPITVRRGLLLQAIRFLLS